MEYRGDGFSSDDQEVASNSKNRKIYHRHTPQQIQRLEEFFKECPHPDEAQRRQLSRELNLEAKQIKFWFQNKRTQAKAQHERADNTLLRAENERIQCENIAIREALKNVICPGCGGPPFGEEERQRNIEKLQEENARLKEEHEKVSGLLTKYIGKPVPVLSLPGPSVHRCPGPMNLVPTMFNPLISMMNPHHDPNHALFLTHNNTNNTNNLAIQMMPSEQQMHQPFIGELESAMMSKTAATAMEELISLVQMNEPFWVNSPVNGRYVIHRDSYDKVYPRPSRFKSTGARVESSKDSGIVAMDARLLVDVFLDAEKWMEMFPTIVNKASIIHVLDPGLLGNGSCFLQLMYEQIHILSPLVAPRELLFLRCCQQIEAGVWVIADISYDLKDVHYSSSSWKLPSGCMIQELPNGTSKVTWVEHVEVDDKAHTHRLYRELLCNGGGYGAQRWIINLQRMSERLALATLLTNPGHDFGGLVAVAEGRRNIMKLGERMVKNFSGMLSMSGKLDFPQLSEAHNSGVRVSVRRSSDDPGQPAGLIVSAASSLWLPISPQSVFSIFKDEEQRNKWDVLSQGNPVSEIARVVCGSHDGNFISVLRPFIPTEISMLMLQECHQDALGAMVVYAPLDIPTMNVAISGDDPSNLPILPSGFIISTDGRPGETSSGTGGCGSLLTVAFQILVSSPAYTTEVSMESVATVNTLISSTIQRVKAMLDCTDLD